MRRTRRLNSFCLSYFLKFSAAPRLAQGPQLPDLQAGHWQYILNRLVRRAQASHPGAVPEPLKVRDHELLQPYPPPLAHFFYSIWLILMRRGCFFCRISLPSSPSWRTHGEQLRLCPERKPSSGMNKIKALVLVSGGDVHEHGAIASLLNQSRPRSARRIKLYEYAAIYYTPLPSYWVFWRLIARYLRRIKGLVVFLDLYDGERKREWERVF